MLKSCLHTIYPSFPPSLLLQKSLIFLSWKDWHLHICSPPFPLLLKLPSLFYNLTVLLLCWTHTFSFSHLASSTSLSRSMTTTGFFLTLPWHNPSQNRLPHILLISHLMSFCLLPQESQWIALPSLLGKIQWTLLSPCVFRPLRILS